MRRRDPLLSAVIVVLIGAGAAARAQQSAVIDIDAMTALQKMGAYLRSLPSFQVEGITSTEEVRRNGEKVQFDGATRIVARMPDRLRITVTNDRQDRLYVYDGKQFTLFARRVNSYATIPAPSTIGPLALAAALDAKYGVGLPLETLFRLGARESKDETIESAMFVGHSEIAGVACGHYAFRQEGLDWQVWIQSGDRSLPRKLIVTTLTDAAQPQYIATLVWDLTPSFDDAAFTFTPPNGAHRIVLPDVK